MTAEVTLLSDEHTEVTLEVNILMTAVGAWRRLERERAADAR